MPSDVIQWFPGHMAKTRRLIKENLSLVDIVIELLDARIPYSSKNPEIGRICENKPILTVFNKSSLSDPAVNKEWIAYYKSKNGNPLFIDCKTGAGLKNLEPEIRRILKDKIDRYEEKGMAGKRLKAMIVGIPNVGKSTLINRLAGASKAKAEDRPGVTQNKQWVATSMGIDLLDMPGVLWPKFEDRRVGQCLAATGAIKDEILDIETVASDLLSLLAHLANDKLCARYRLDPSSLEGKSGREILWAVGKKRGCLIAGGEIDTERAAALVLDEFRSCKIGQISLESPALFNAEAEGASDALPEEGEHDHA